VDDLTGLDRRFSHLYDIFSYVYIPWSRAVFAFVGGEKRNRRDLVERMRLHGGKILEVSIGPGPNLPFLYETGRVGRVYGLDISPGQLKRCRFFARKGGWEVELFLGTAENLPFREDAFDTVFHMGGINFFNDRSGAVNEMIRVAKPGTRLLIGDENEKGAKFYEGTLPGFSSSFKDGRVAVRAPVELIPAEMEEVTLESLWKGYFYSISFTKPG
jgi:ubiquinone/menaquinone biosynthesis C-methylase UbiE